MASTSSRAAGASAEPAPLFQGNPPPGASPESGGQAILTALGETLYDWDVAGDRLRWGANAAAVLGVEPPALPESGAAYDALVDPDSVTNRHEAVLNGIGIDYGAGVPYEITYALKLPRAGGMRTIWVHDCGLWQADADGRPTRARGAIRLARAQAGEGAARPVALDLPRRADFLKLLDSVIAVGRHYRTHYAFAVLSVDNMPVVAETLGPTAMDEAEAVILERVQSALRGGDRAGRLSDIEIGLILKVGDEKEAGRAAERILAAVADRMVETSAGPIGAMVSAGIVMIPAGADSVEDCLSHARWAQREAKQRGSRQIVFSPGGRRPQRSRQADAATADLLARALREDRLVLACQPAVRAGDGSVAFHECLARLAQDDGTLMPMGEAIGIAEALGLMRLIDLRVQELVFDLLDRHPDRVLAFNVSAETLRDPTWLDRYSRHVAGRPDIARRTIMEITETALIHDVDAVGRTMRQLRELGCRTAIDDFGAGYTSFRNLQILPVDIVKIDGSFIRTLQSDPDNSVFVQTLIALARNFGIETVAEMVENRPTADDLMALGVDYLQGFHFGRPDACFAGLSGEPAAP
jgi:diguanylate cyclase (GGDEF)-like protein